MLIEVFVEGQIFSYTSNGLTYNRKAQKNNWKEEKQPKKKDIMYCLDEKKHD